jgi:hypothetical protein
VSIAPRRRKPVAREQQRAAGHPSAVDAEIHTAGRTSQRAKARGLGRACWAKFVAGVVKRRVTPAVAARGYGRPTRATCRLFIRH